MITFLLEAYPDNGLVFHKTCELPDDAGEGLIVSAARDLAVLYLQERKKATVAGHDTTNEATS